MSPLDSVLKDLVFAARMSLRNPGFSVTAIFTIALGIGSNTVIFSVVNSVLLRQLPYDAPDRLVSLSEPRVSSPGADDISFASARAYREQSRTLEYLVQCNDSDGGRLVLSGGAEELRGQSVSPDFFRMLGVRAEIGRVFLPQRRSAAALESADYQSVVTAIGRLLRDATVGAAQAELNRIRRDVDPGRFKSLGSFQCIPPAGSERKELTR